MVLMDDAPEPKVLTVLAPVARVEFPLEARVVKLAEPGVVAPMVVKFPAAGVVTPMLALLIVPPVIVAELELRLLIVAKPVPVVKVFVPLTVTGPFKLTAPVPVLNALFPV